MKLNSQNPQINFQSRIVACSCPRFARFMHEVPLGCEAKMPWTIKDTCTGTRIYTRRVSDCTAGTIVAQNKTGTMFHLCPDSYSDENPFEEFVNEIHDKLAGKPLSGLLLGSISSKLLGGRCLSENLFNDLQKFFKEKLAIPFSYFRGQTTLADTHLAYDGIEDTYLIYKPFKYDFPSLYSSKTKEKIFLDSFDEIFIHPNDKLELDF